MYSSAKSSGLCRGVSVVCVECAHQTVKEVVCWNAIACRSLSAASPQLRQLVNWCINPNPDSRPAVSEVCRTAQEMNVKHNSARMPAEAAPS